MSKRITKIANNIKHEEDTGCENFEVNVIKLLKIVTNSLNSRRESGYLGCRLNHSS